MDVIKLFKSQKEDKPIKCIEKLIKIKRYNDANWLIAKLMNYSQRVEYAVYAADQVIDIFEKKYPNDDRPRKAIEAARRCIKNPSKKNKAADATAAAAAAYTATDAYTDAYAAAYAADSAYAAAYTAAAAYADYDADAADATYAAAYNAAAAAAYAYATTDAAYAYTGAYAMRKKILLTGLRILKEGLRHVNNS